LPQLRVQLGPGRDQDPGSRAADQLGDPLAGQCGVDRGGGIPGGFVAALLAIPTAGALQVLVKEAWRATAPDQSQASPPAAEPDESAVQRGERPSTPAGHFPRGLGERLRHGGTVRAAEQHDDRP
jgi:hypothetical protein